MIRKFALPFKAHSHYPDITMRPIRAIIAALTLVIAAPFAPAQTPADSLAAAPDSIAAVDSTATAPRRGLIGRIIDYFKESNAPTRHKGLNFSIIGGPHYSSDTKLGIGLVAAGQYYAAPENDTVTLMSNISLTGDVTTGGFYKVGIGGNHYSHGNRWRIDYDVDFYQFLRKFWGIGYDAGIHVNDYEKFTELFIQCKADFLRDLGHNFYLGPTVEFDHAKANDVDNPALWNHQRLSTYTTTVGLKLLYDSRDNLTATQRGWMASLSQRFSPRFLGNHYSFSTTELTASGFWPGWKDAIICAHVHTQFNYGNVPWSMMATFGGSDIMRGYYEGRFRDKCETDITLELRQHIWRRNGIVLWVGAGSVYDKPQNLRWKHILPNGGIGYRWEFKKRTNVRLDFGIGRGETSFIFNINEAF